MPALPRPRSSGFIVRQQQRAEEGEAEEFESQGKPSSGGAKLNAAATWTSAMAGKTAALLAVPPKLALPALALTLLTLLWLGGLGPFAGPSEPKTLTFLSVGDFGVGTENQKEVAEQMAKVAKQHGAKFVVSVGDNIYNVGVKSQDDPLFWTNFENIYTQPPLQTQWLMTLGDHDHRGDVAAQVAFTHKSNKWYMPAPYYSKSIPVGPPSSPCSLDIIITDSIGLEGAVAGSDPKERRFSDEYNRTFAGPKAGTKQLGWFKQTLAASTADWKLVVGHRPVLTAGVRPRFPAEARFTPLIQPILEQYKVDVYLHGHDHVGQHLEQGGVVYLGNGVGGYGNHDTLPTNETVWADGKYSGFMLHRVTPESFTTDFIAKNGTIVHSAVIHRPTDGQDSGRKSNLR